MACTPTQTNINQVSIPCYAKACVEAMLGKARAYTCTTNNPYKFYTGNTVAQFSPLQKQAMDNAQAMQAAPQLQCASAMAGTAGLAALNAGYTYNPYTAQQINAPTAQAATMNAAKLGAANTMCAASMNAAKLGQANKMCAASMQAARLGAAPTNTAASFNGPGNIGYNSVATGNFLGQGTACAYMNPYLQASLNPQLQQMRQAQQIQHQQNQASAVGAGAFGGSRCAVLQGAQNQADQLAQQNLIGNAYNQAYKCATQMFTTCQARALQAQQANQATRLTACQANQQVGYNTALQNAQLAQQSGLANQAMQGQYGLAQAGFCQATGQYNASNQQAANAANQAALNQFAITQAGFCQSANQYNAGNQQAANAANQAAKNQFAITQAGFCQAANQYNAGNSQQVALANAQASLAAQQANQNAMQSAANLNAQQGQFGANLGLQGLQTANAAATNLANIGNTQYNQNMGITNELTSLGGMQQQQCQNMLNAKYQCAINAQNYQGNQINFMSNILRGLPMSNTTSNLYSAPPSMLSQVAGAGIAAAGLNKIGSAKGGVISKKGGLKCLALSKMGV